MDVLATKVQLRSGENALRLGIGHALEHLLLITCWFLRLLGILDDTACTAVLPIIGIVAAI